MSTQSLAPVVPTSQASPFLDTCKRCASPDLFIKAQGPHFGLFCRQCDLWQKWIRKSEAGRFKVVKAASKPTYPEASEQVRADFDSPSDDAHKSCHERFEKIERELTVVVRAVLACGVLSGRGAAPGINISDELVDRLARELAEGGVAR
jgi:hypothetical protein